MTVVHPSVKVRTASLDDAGPIAQLGSHVFSTTFGYSVTPDQLKTYLNEAYSPAAIASDISSPDKDMLVAVDESGAVIGFTLLTRGSLEPCVKHLDKCVELQRLYVGLEQHGKGVGKALAQVVDVMAREQGFKNIWLGVWEENHKAQRVYEKLGYQKIGEHVFDVGGDLQTDWIMFKPL